MDTIQHLLYDFLISAGLSETSSKYLNMLALLIGALIIIFIVDFIMRKLLINAFTVFAHQSKSKFDNILVKNKVTRNIAHIIPLILALELIPIVFKDFDYFENIIEKGLQVYAIILTLWIVRSVFNSMKDYLKTLPRFKDKPVDSYIQVFMIFAWIIGIFSIFAIVTGISFWKFATTLGAASAIIILVFRDTILGFVASIQVSINDMVRIGDWISFDKFGADGDVIEINLATVKVQNFDNTITTIPTYALISDSFKNWRGMDESKGRRIKRALNIRMESVKNLNEDEIFKLSKIQLISDYVIQRSNDIKEYNQTNSVDKSLLINGRNLTNIGLFRKYMETYIEGHSAINKDLMVMVRQLHPTAYGLPIEIYAFSSDKRWQNYEYIIADIFDHMIASVSDFYLVISEPSVIRPTNK